MLFISLNYRFLTGLTKCNTTFPRLVIIDMRVPSLSLSLRSLMLSETALVKNLRSFYPTSELRSAWGFSTVRPSRCRQLFTLKSWQLPSPLALRPRFYSFALDWRKPASRH